MGEAVSVPSAMLALDGLHCSACVKRVEQVLASHQVQGEVDLASRAVSLRLAAGSEALAAVTAALKRAGLQPRPVSLMADAPASPAPRRRALARIGLAVIGAMQVMMLAWPGYVAEGIDADVSALFRWSQWLIATPVVVWAGWPFFRGAFAALRQRSLTMDVPVALSLAIAYSASAARTLAGDGELYFDAATMFVALLLMGRHWEAATRARAATHLHALAGALPLMAERLDAGDASETVPLSALRAGDRLRVSPGEVVPVDGVLETAAALDESLLTGESTPVARYPGDAALAGSLNQGRCPLVLRADSVGDATQVAGILRLLQRAAARKPAVQQVADRVAGHFTMVVLVLAAVGGALALLRGETAMTVVIAVLVASCPCALSLAVPAALAAGTSRLATQGVLVARSDRLLRLADVDTVLFDKTGTLTEATLRVVETIVAGAPLADAAAIAAALEAGLPHPIARAFAAAADGRTATSLEVTPGQGVQGRVGGQWWQLGPAAITADLDPALTWITLADSGGARVHFGLAATLRDSAAGLVARLRAAGLSVALLTGDAAGAARAVATQSGIAAVASRQRPAHKLAILRALQAEGRVVMAVGDGLNDAPFLAAADVSVALPGGAAATQARADLILVGDRLEGLWLARSVAQQVRRRVRQNLAWAALYNLSVLPLAMAGWLPPWLAAAGMSISSLWVVANALRLRLPESASWKVSTC